MAKKASLLKLSPSKMSDVFSPKMLVIYAAFLIALYFLLNNLSAAQNAVYNAVVDISPNVAVKILGQRWVAPLYAENGSSESGSAMLVAVGNQTKVTVRVGNEPAGVSQPSHIHVGSCPGVGPIIYPLNDIVKGQSVTTLNVRLSDLQKMGPLAVNVHKSAAQMGVFVSCANLK